MDNNTQSKPDVMTNQAPINLLSGLEMLTPSIQPTPQPPQNLEPEIMQTPIKPSPTEKIEQEKPKIQIEVQKKEDFKPPQVETTPIVPSIENNAKNENQVEEPKPIVEKQLDQKNVVEQNLAPPTKQKDSSDHSHTRSASVASPTRLEIDQNEKQSSTISHIRSPSDSALVKTPRKFEPMSINTNWPSLHIRTMQINVSFILVLTKIILQSFTDITILGQL